MMRWMLGCTTFMTDNNIVEMVLVGNNEQEAALVKREGEVDDDVTKVAVHLPQDKEAGKENYEGIHQRMQKHCGDFSPDYKLCNQCYETFTYTK